MTNESSDTGNPGGDRDNAEFDTGLAVALRQAGRHAEAVSRLKFATTRLPPDARVFLELGYQLVLMDRYDEAIDVLEHGLQIAPTMLELSVQLGYAHLSRADCSNAKVAFARALDLSPHSGDALFGIAKAHQEVGENEAAAAYFRR